MFAKKPSLVGMIVLLALALTACAPTVDPGTVATAIAGTQAAQMVDASATAAKATNDAVPTATLTPRPTDTPAPTETPAPTDTPAPTNTPEPTLTPTPEPAVIAPDTAAGLAEVDKFSAPNSGVYNLFWSSDNARILVWTCEYDPSLLALTGCGFNGRNSLTVFSPQGSALRVVPLDILSYGTNQYSGNGRIIYVVDDSLDAFNPIAYYLDVGTGQRINMPAWQVLGLDDTGQIAVGNEGFGLFLARLAAPDKTLIALEAPKDYFEYSPAVISPDGGRVAQMMPGVTIVGVWDTTTGKLTVKLPISGKRGADVAFYGHGALVGLYYFDAINPRLEMWDAQTGRKVGAVAWDGKMQNRQPIAVSPDGRLLALATVANVNNRASQVIEFYDTTSGKVAATVPVPGADIGGVSFSGDGRYLAFGQRSAAGSENWDVHIWAVRP